MPDHHFLIGGSETKRENDRATFDFHRQLLFFIEKHYYAFFLHHFSSRISFLFQTFPSDCSPFYCGTTQICNSIHNDLQRPSLFLDAPWLSFFDNRRKESNMIFVGVLM